MLAGADKDCGDYYLCQGTRSFWLCGRCAPRVVFHLREAGAEGEAGGWGPCEVTRFPRDAAREPGNDDEGGNRG